MAVIAGDGAEELHLFQLAPGGAAHNAGNHGASHRVVHHIQAGVAVDDNLVGANLHHVGHEFLAFVNAIQHAVVAAIRAVFAGQVTFTVEHIHHVHGKIQLLLAGLAASHVQRQLAVLILCILGFELAFQFQQFLPGQFGIGFHQVPPCYGICKFGC